MIQYIHDGSQAKEWGGLFFPTIVCDACSRPIEGDGNVYWLMLANDDIAPGVWHTHKDACALALDDAIRRQLGGEGSLVMWEELRDYLAQLAHNLAHLPDAARTR